MGKVTTSFDYKTLASYLLPKDILKFFDVTGVEEVHTQVRTKSWTVGQKFAYVLTRRKGISRNTVDSV